MKWPTSKDEFFEKLQTTRNNLKESFNNASASIPDIVVDKYDDTIDNIQTVSSISRDVIITKLLFDTTEGKLILGSFCVLSFGIGFKCGKMTTQQQPIIWKRYNQISDIPATTTIGGLKKSSIMLRGKVLSVTDGDTIRILHTPIPMVSSSKLGNNEKLSDVTLPIRICSIDTPEIAKFVRYYVCVDSVFLFCLFCLF